MGPLRIAVVALLALAAPLRGETVLFVGNSFTFGAFSPTWRYRADTVTDLNGDGVGGVPALFRLFAAQLGLDWQVSLETSPGKDLRWHWENRREAIDRRWDRVVLQDYSTLDAARPGDGTNHLTYARAIAAALRARNPAVEVAVTATWSRPDLTYRPGSPWSGRPIESMAEDLARAAARTAGSDPAIRRVLPVGAAFNRAIAAGVADANPYDGIAPGLIDLWAGDHYHASAHGYYLEALVVLAGLTGADPRRLGAEETAAAELGIAPGTAVRLQQVAWEVTRAPG